MSEHTGAYSMSVEDTDPVRARIAKPPKPCRCRSSDVRTHFIEGEEDCWEPYWDIVCHGCGTGCDAPTEAEAIAAWNADRP